MNKDVYNWIYKNLVWFLVVFGVFILYASSTEWFNAGFSSILEKLGLAIFSSGIFAAVLKSIQFTGIFKEEIEKVVVDSSFIEKRNDLPDLWRRISKSIHHEKFPSISDELESIVLDKYFPTNHKYFYNDFRYTLNITELTNDNIIKYTENIEFKVVLASDVDEATIFNENTIDKDNLEQDTLVNELVCFEVNGKNVLDEIRPKESENKFEQKKVIAYTLKNGREFQLRVNRKKEYNIEADNFKLMRVKSLTKEMDVSISYPENLLVSFFSIGTVNQFERKHTEHKRTISRTHKNGVILPYQGFGMSFGIKKS